MTLRFLLVLALIAVLTSCGLKQIKTIESQYVPVSTRYPGLEFKGSDGLVTIELVYDVTCRKDFIKVLIQSTLISKNGGKLLVL